MHTATVQQRDTHTAADDRKDVGPLLQGSNRRWPHRREENWERGGGAGCWGERLAEVASYSGPRRTRAIEPAVIVLTRRELNCCSVLLLLLRDLLLWQPQRKPLIGRVEYFATYSSSVRVVINS